MSSRKPTPEAFAADRATIRRMEKNSARACELLATMANPSRLMVLCHLAESERSVGELQPLIGLSQSALSQHLALLRERRLVVTRRQGQQIFYRLASGQAKALMRTLHDEFCRPTRRS